MSYLLDTHALIWLINNDAQLPTKVKNKLVASEKKEKLSVCAFSFWEIAMLHKRSRLVLPLDVHKWISQILEQPTLQVIPLNPQILIRSVHLPDEFPADPADRIIAATALEQGCYLVTKDGKIRNSRAVQTYWED